MDEERIINQINAVSAASAKGPRPKDEDFILTWEMKIGASVAHALFLLDGMGGGQAGEKASEMGAVFAMRHISDVLGEEHVNDQEARHEMLLGAILNADRAVRALAEEIGDGARCGSTLVVYLVIDSAAGSVEVRHAEHGPLHRQRFKKRAICGRHIGGKIPLFLQH